MWAPKYPLLTKHDYTTEQSIIGDEWEEGDSLMLRYKYAQRHNYKTIDGRPLINTMGPYQSLSGYLIHQTMFIMTGLLREREADIALVQEVGTWLEKHLSEYDPELNVGIYDHHTHIII